MTDVLDPASMIEAAQEAVVTGDYHGAERLLREAAAVQEANLGPLHPDLARTLSDLAIICERTDKLAEAERNYRRAHAIAVASLSPRDPFVAASVRNLVDFCAAQGIPIWRPPAARFAGDTPYPEINELELYASEATAPKPVVPEATVSAVSPPDVSAPDVSVSDVTAPDVTAPDVSAPDVSVSEVNAFDVGAFELGAVPIVQEGPAGVGRTPARHTIALLALAAIVILLVPVVVRWSRTFSVSGSPEPAPVARTETAAPAQPTSNTPATPADVTARPEVTAPSADATAPSVDVTAAQVDAPAPPGERPEPGAAGSAPTQVSVLRAQICSAIERVGSPDWQCASASGDLRPGTYAFYTRVLTNASTIVEHRWYRDDRVHQVVKLRIAASPGVGYRTFSSTTISPERAGNWRVELRTADGTLLDEERFLVQR